MDKPIIEVKDLGKKFQIPHPDTGVIRDFWALQDINLSIAAGSTVAVLGANGSGKSTLFKMLCEVSPPSVGSITLRGGISSLLEVGVGFHPELTGRENIYLNGAFLGMRRREIKSKLEDIIAMSAIGDFLNLPVKRYSSGMVTRLAFAIVAYLRTDILILDEVLAVSDRKFQKMAIDRVKQRAAEGGTVLMSSHDPHVLEEVCDRAIVLSKGKLMGEGPYQEMASKYLQLQESIGFL
jgi:lipopolysaccharide transport system ATP-binding protein